LVNCGDDGKPRNPGAATASTVIGTLTRVMTSRMRCRNRVKADAANQKKNNAASAKQVPKTKK